MGLLDRQTVCSILTARVSAQTLAGMWLAGQPEAATGLLSVEAECQKIQTMVESGREASKPKDGASTSQNGTGGDGGLVGTR